MGLDMYLYREQYVSGYKFNDESDTRAYDLILEAIGLDRFDTSPHATVSICVAYWRKANAIHKWFCDLDGGRDECQRIPVNVEQLRQLRYLCDSVLLQPAIAQDVLPPQSGFFFGSNEIDEWYMDDMKHTITQIDNALKDIPIDASPWDYSFIYQASW